jgi:hypothetical protein
MEAMSRCIFEEYSFHTEPSAYRSYKIAREIKRAGYATDEFWDAPPPTRVHSNDINASDAMVSTLASEDEVVYVLAGSLTVDGMLHLSSEHNTWLLVEGDLRCEELSIGGDFVLVVRGSTTTQTAFLNPSTFAHFYGPMNVARICLGSSSNVKFKMPPNPEIVTSNGIWPYYKLTWREVAFLPKGQPFVFSDAIREATSIATFEEDSKAPQASQLAELFRQGAKLQG